MKKIILLIAIWMGCNTLIAQISNVPNSANEKISTTCQISGIDENGKALSYTGSKEAVYYDPELLPGMEFTGSWYYHQSSSNYKVGNLVENPEVEWLTVTPSTFVEYNDSIATKVDFNFTAPTAPGFYSTSVDDANGHWSSIIITLTVTETPTPNLTYYNTVPTHENFVIERNYTAPLYLFWEDVNQYYYFSGCLMINQHEQVNKSWFNINPETICLDPGQSVNTHYTASFSQPLYDSVLVVRTRRFYGYPFYYRFIYNAQIMSVSRPVDLHPGWNLIGYSLSSPTTPEAAFSPLIAAGVLQMITGFDQGGKFFDPSGPPQFNTLTEIKNGLGYWVKVNADYPGFTFP
ncbi:MAG TPA: hypothetical protein PLI65_03095 [Bacteroidales bacterium]|nr:hypothetical protein [Bacteroidales bacterium]